MQSTSIQAKSRAQSVKHSSTTHIQTTEHKQDCRRSREERVTWRAVADAEARGGRSLRADADAEARGGRREEGGACGPAAGAA